MKTRATKKQLCLNATTKDERDYILKLLKIVHKIQRKLKISNSPSISNFLNNNNNNIVRFCMIRIFQKAYCVLCVQKKLSIYHKTNRRVPQCTWNFLLAVKIMTGTKFH